MSDQQSSGKVRVYTDLTAFHEGHPRIEASVREVCIRLADSIFLSMSVEHWCTLNAAVWAAIAAQATQGGAE